MIKLEDKNNVNAPNAEYPYGSVRDKTSSVAGTLWNKEMMNDAIQFFEKMFAESGIVSNGLPDNETNGFQLFEALRAITKPYKVFTAHVAQTGTNNPVLTVFKNEFGANIVPTRSATGIYFLTLNGAFVINKTAIFVNAQRVINSAVAEFISAHHASPDVVLLRSVRSSTISIGVVNYEDGVWDSDIEIRVYD